LDVLFVMIYKVDLLFEKTTAACNFLLLTHEGLKGFEDFSSLPKTIETVGGYLAHYPIKKKCQLFLNDLSTLDKEGKTQCQKNELEVFKIYKDEGISAKSVDRPGLQELLDDCKNGLFSMVAVWTISRLPRKQLDFLTLIEEFKKLNVKFFSFKENIDASTTMGMAMLQMMGSFAELERNNTVESVKSGMAQRAREGLYNDGSMLGYTSIEKHLIIVEDEALIVRNIFNLYLSGRGFKAIANQLNHEGFKTKRN
jgi:DNA invertase Pin-like site-specific DNA recombinase